MIKPKIIKDVFFNPISILKLIENILLGESSVPASPQPKNILIFKTTCPACLSYYNVLFFGQNYLSITTQNE